MVSIAQAPAGSIAAEFVGSKTTFRLLNQVSEGVVAAAQTALVGSENIKSRTFPETFDVCYGARRKRLTEPSVGLWVLQEMPCPHMFLMIAVCSS